MLNIPEYEEGKKYLVVAGCSFTAPTNKWPEGNLPNDGTSNSWGEHAADELDMVCINAAFSGVGNNMIMRQVLYTLSRMFDMEYPTSAITVGVMWSGYDRTEIYKHDWEPKIGAKGVPFQPRRPIKDSNGEWIPFNPATVSYIEEQLDSKTPFIKFNPKAREYVEIGKSIYFKTWANEVQRIIHSLQCVMGIQEFLINRNIKYFFHRYVEDCFSEQNEVYEDPEISWINNLINWKKFIPSGEFEWCYENTKTKFIEETRLGWDRKHNIMHPTVLQHKKYAEEMVVPFIKNL